MREREGERELVSVEKKWKRNEEKKKKTSCGLLGIDQNGVVLFSSEYSLLWTRTTCRSVTRNNTSFLTYSNDKSFDTHERHAV